MANSCRLLGLADGVTNPTEGLALRQGLTNAFDLQMALAYFPLGGICERHPDLRVAFLEGTGGWVVPIGLSLGIVAVMGLVMMGVAIVTFSKPE